MKEVINQDIYTSVINMLPEKEIDLNTSFSELGLSSMEIMEIVCMIEDKYAINVKNEDLNKIRDIQSLIKCISSYSEKT